MGTVGSLVFTGLSSFSADFQTILQRTVSIAQLPVKALQNQQTDNLAKKQALIALNPAVASLASAISALGTVASKAGLTASSSDSSKVTAVNTGTSVASTYTISNIVSLASAASETTLTGYADPATTPVSTQGQNQVDLVVGSATYHLDLTGKNNLNALRDAINTANDGANPGVTATILTNTDGSYISVTSNTAGQTTLQLNDVPATGPSVSLVTNADQGSNADFYLNGTIHVTRSTNVINDVVPGVSFSVTGTTTGSVKISLATDRSQLSNALQAFATSYNALATSLSGQVGTAGGPLSGDGLIRDISGDLHQFAGYFSGTGSIRSLSDLGVSFDTAGQVSFDQATFDTLSETQISDAFKFIGSSNSGLAQLASSFTQFSDPVNGLIRVEEDGMDTTNTTLTNRISVLNAQVAQIQTTTSAKLQAADALIIKLQSQQTALNAAIQSINFVAFGKSTGST
jgi:flagellar hook-associated protein 2